MTIDTTKFSSPALTYNVKSADSVFSWEDAAATSVNSLTATCGAFTWTVTKADGSTIDTIFTGDYTSTTKTLSVQTDLFTKVATYNMRVKVQYTNYSTVSKIIDFSIKVTSPCLTDSFTISNTIFGSPAYTYKVLDPSGVFSWTDSDATS